ncbi:MAG: saccharopine dehydrogenase NADP-binding domain-containing protein [Thermoplasmata archaeon]|nr:saccharopine dehydrogenase NADP-binding domain-containing protein [Thermoplasmata archaeon]
MPSEPLLGVTVTSRIVILGAAGIVGQGIARQLRSRGVSNVVLVDLRSDPLATLARELETESAVADVTDPTALAGVLRDSQLVVNATLYYQNRAVMEACLASNCSYLDLGGLYHMTLRQLELASQFRKADLLAILGAGKAPGITNVLAAHGARAFDRLTEVHLRSGRRSLDERAAFSLPYAASTLLDEFTLAPVVLDRGALHEIPPLSGRERVTHPPPFGAIDYVTTLHSELATLPAFLGRGLETLDFKVGLSRATADALENLVRLGFASSEPLPVGGVSVRHREFTASLLSRIPSVAGPEAWITEAELIGSTHGRRRRLTLRVTGDERQNGTSLAAAATVELFRAGRIPSHGVEAPEAVVPAEPFFELLRSYGLGYAESEGT